MKRKVLFRSKIVLAQLLGIILIVLVVSACEKEDAISEVVLSTDDSLRTLVPTIYFDKPAVWYESDRKTTIEKLIPFNVNDNYHAWISTGDPGTHIYGVSEEYSPKRDWSFAKEVFMWVNDIVVYSHQRDPEMFMLGGIDKEDLYNHELNIDSATIFTQRNYYSKTDFAKDYKSIVYTSGAHADLNTFRFLLTGNAFDNDDTAHPFVASLYFFGEHISKYTTSGYHFFEEEKGIEFRNMRYEYLKGELYILGYDQTNEEFVMMRYSLQDRNGNSYYDEDDTFTKIWETRFGDMEVGGISETLVVGTVTKTSGDTAGKIVRIGEESGSFLWSKTLNLTDLNDGFHGVIKSEKNYFAYGYSNRERTGDIVTQSDGWAIRFSENGDLLGNHIYHEDGATIEVTAGCKGFWQIGYSDRSKVVLGGNRLNSIGRYEAWITKFTHFYDDD